MGKISPDSSTEQTKTDLLRTLQQPRIAMYNLNDFNSQRKLVGGDGDGDGVADFSQQFFVPLMSSLLMCHVNEKVTGKIQQASR